MQRSFGQWVYLGVERVEGGQQHGAVRGDDVLGGGERGVEAEHGEAAGGRAPGEVVRGVEPRRGPARHQARGQRGERRPGLHPPAQRVVAGVPAVQDPTWQPCLVISNRNVDDETVWRYILWEITALRT